MEQEQLQDEKEDTDKRRIAVALKTKYSVYIAIILILSVVLSATFGLVVNRQDNMQNIFCQENENDNSISCGSDLFYAVTPDGDMPTNSKNTCEKGIALNNSQLNAEFFLQVSKVSAEDVPFVDKLPVHEKVRLLE
ncbi:MAG: hypothetical protein IJC89_01905 [Clostridia bacterium]|nr:hypothetical protein [Clostridia bacterium]